VYPQTTLWWGGHPAGKERLGRYQQRREGAQGQPLQGDKEFFVGEAGLDLGEQSRDRPGQGDDQEARPPAPGGGAAVRQAALQAQKDDVKGGHDEPGRRRRPAGSVIGGGQGACDCRQDARPRADEMRVGVRPRVGVAASQQQARCQPPAGDQAAPGEGSPRCQAHSLQPGGGDGAERDPGCHGTQSADDYIASQSRLSHARGSRA
jgi:hypothetical protein